VGLVVPAWRENRRWRAIASPVTHALMSSDVMPSTSALFPSASTPTRRMGWRPARVGVLLWSVERCFANLAIVPFCHSSGIGGSHVAGSSLLASVRQTYQTTRYRG